MDSKLILEAARGTLDGSLSFPEVVGQLLAAGVEYYHVDYVGLRKRFYSAEGGMMATSINYEGLPPVAPEFDAAALRANILDSQRHGQPYREFTRRSVPDWPPGRAECRATSPFCVASASPTGAAPATSTRNGSPGFEPNLPPKSEPDRPPLAKP
jgi:hypothetical protein